MQPTPDLLHEHTFYRYFIVCCWFFFFLVFYLNWISQHCVICVLWPKCSWVNKCTGPQGQVLCILYPVILAFLPSVGRWTLPASANWGRGSRKSQLGYITDKPSDHRSLKTARYKVVILPVLFCLRGQSFHPNIYLSQLTWRRGVLRKT